MTAFLDERPKPVRSLSRFLTFGLIAVIGISGLDRSAVLPADRRRWTARRRWPRETAPSSSRSSLRAASSTTATDARSSPTFRRSSSRSVRPTCRGRTTGRGRDRLAALLRMTRRRHQRRDRLQPRLALRPRPDREDVDEIDRRLIAEAGYELPGVEVVVEARRQYADGPLLRRSSATPARSSGEQLAELKNVGYLPDDLIGKAGVEVDLRERAPRRLRQRERRARRRGPRKSRSSRPIAGAAAGRLAPLDDRHEGAGVRREGAPAGAMRAVGPQARRGHRDEPADRRGPGDGQPADLRQQPVRARHQHEDYTKLLEQPGQAAAQPRDQAHYPPGSTYKLVAGTGVLADGKITPHTKVRRAAT